LNKCEICGAEKDLVEDTKDGQVLCQRCFNYKVFKEMVDEGNEDAIKLMNIIERHYPNNMEKQKDFLCAIFELIDMGERTPEGGVSVTTKQLVEVAEKWHVEEALMGEAVIALLEHMLSFT